MDAPISINYEKQLQVAPLAYVQAKTLCKWKHPTRFICGTREEVSSPKVLTETIMLTAVIEAEEDCNVVATLDILNAFIQTKLNFKDDEGNRTIMKIHRQLVDIIACELDNK